MCFSSFSREVVTGSSDWGNVAISNWLRGFEDVKMGEGWSGGKALQDALPKEVSHIYDVNISSFSSITKNNIETAQSILIFSKRKHRNQQLKRVVCTISCLEMSLTSVDVFWKNGQISRLQSHSTHWCQLLCCCKSTRKSSNLLSTRSNGARSWCCWWWGSWALWLMQGFDTARFSVVKSWTLQGVIIQAFYNLYANIALIQRLSKGNRWLAISCLNGYNHCFRSREPQCCSPPSTAAPSTARPQYCSSPSAVRSPVLFAPFARQYCSPAPSTARPQYCSSPTAAPSTVRPPVLFAPQYCSPPVLFEPCSSPSAVRSPVLFALQYCSPPSTAAPSTVPPQYCSRYSPYAYSAHSTFLRVALIFDVFALYTSKCYNSSSSSSTSSIGLCVAEKRFSWLECSIEDWSLDLTIFLRLPAPSSISQSSSSCNLLSGVANTCRSAWFKNLS